MPVRSAQYAATIERYATYREAAYRETQDLLRRKHGWYDLFLREIDQVALAEAARWPAFSRNGSSYRDGFDWDWSRIDRYYAVRFPKRFDLAIYRSATLCGLSLGRTSKKGSRLYVDFIEGSPDPVHPLRGHVILVTLTAAEAYAHAIGAYELRIRKPHKDILHLYGVHGYTYVEDGIADGPFRGHMVKRIADG